MDTCTSIVGVASPSREQRATWRGLVNGDEIELPGGCPTGGDLKRRFGRSASDFVLYREPDGVHHLLDDEAVPAAAQRVTFAPSWRFGRR